MKLVMKKIDSLAIITMAMNITNIITMMFTMTMTITMTMIMTMI